MTRNKAAKLAARERAQITGKYTTALRQTQQERGRDDVLRIPVAALDSSPDGGYIEIGPFGGHGIIERRASAAARGTGIGLMQAVAERYPSHRVQFAAWGYSDAELVSAGLTSNGHMWRAASSSTSLTAFLDDHIEPEVSRRSGLLTREGLSSWPQLCEADPSRTDLPTLLVVVNTTAAVGGNQLDTAPRGVLWAVTKVGRSLEVFLVIDSSSGSSHHGLMEDLARNFTWKLPSLDGGGW